MSLGRTKRLGQEKGPFEIKFKDFDQDFYTFCNVDGEYYKFMNPDVMTIKLTEKLPKGRIRILVRNIKKD